jgi:FAD/FMN-containing dehydrogenase/Fe-S oxidoreductase
VTDDRISDLAAHLGSASACVSDTTLTRALYSSDASLYRVVPLAVARPRDRDELLAVLDGARRVGVPITPRGAGTSCAGNAVGPGLVVDVSLLRTIHAIDPDAATATVDPGVVQESLQRAAAPYGLRFGPDPSTSTRCTIGGMVGNNACGPRALGYGTSAANMVDGEIVTGSGETLTLSSPGVTGQRVIDLVAANLGTVRTEFGRFGRQVSGYSLEHLLPEKGRDLARFFAGTEGTLGFATRLTVRLVGDPAHRVTVALGYATMADAADAMPVVLPFRPTACEGLDRRIVDVVRRQLGDSAVPPLPRGDGWVFVEISGEDLAEATDRARKLVAAAGAIEGWVADPVSAAALWKIRADGAGLAGVSLSRPAHGGWEDAAVPPDRLGVYLRDFDALLTSYGLEGLPYGHFGDGCVHCRIDFPLTALDGPLTYRSFVDEAARLAASYGGSMSGEHGDGRARSALLPAMYSPDAIALFGAVKHIFDPDALMNPGVLVDPRPVEADMREAARRTSALTLRHPHFAEAVHQCTGVGKCVAVSGTGQVMCPSYQATGLEKDSTRGRARVLQEMVNGTLVTDGWRAPEVLETLDLCLSCKGCARDCPTGTDMAHYKSVVLDEAYRGRLRPISHYTLGRLPFWTRLVGRVPGLAAVANTVLGLPGIGTLGKRAAGLDARRSVPRFAGHPQRRTVAAPPRPGKPVVIWVDSFTDAFEGIALAALVAVLVDAGFAPRLLDRDACCGLTWITTGQRDAARAHLRKALDVLHPVVSAGTPVVGMEPSCLAVWRSDAAELLPDDPRVAVVAAGISTLAELLATVDGWTPPDLSGHTIVAQPHCHHASVLGWKADAALLAKTGATVRTLGGCCGLAGNFGVEAGHYETSVAVAENELLPALRAADPDAIVLADGFSCRTQVADLSDRHAMTLAELLVTHSAD